MKSVNFARMLKNGVSTFAVVSMAGLTAHAQQTDDDGTVIEEIIVSAQKA